MPWVQQTLDLMLPYLPAPPVNFTPPVTTALPPPMYSLVPVNELELQHLKISTSSNGHSLKSNGDSRQANWRLPCSVNGHSSTANGHVNECTVGSRPVNGHAPAQTAPTRSKDPGGDGSKPSDWVWARLTQNRRVTSEDWWQNVREIELELEDQHL